MYYTKFSRWASSSILWIVSCLRARIYLTEMFVPIVTPPYVPDEAALIHVDTATVGLLHGLGVVSRRYSSACHQLGSSTPGPYPSLQQQAAVVPVYAVARPAS